MRIHAATVLALVVLGACAAPHPPVSTDWRKDCRTHFDAGKDAHARGDEVAAEREFRAALEYARFEHPPGLATGLCLSALAALLVDEGRLDEAEPALNEGMAILESRLGTHTEQYAILLTNRGDLQMKRRRYAAAEADFRRALDIADELKPGSDDLRMRTRVMLVGSMCLQGRFDDGDELGKAFGMKCRRDLDGTPADVGVPQ